MPSLTALANTAANGWRKLKEEALTYTPPSSEGPKPMRSPDRKLRKMSILQLTDLPRPVLKVKTTKEIQLGLPQTFIRMCESDKFFRERMSPSCSLDMPVFCGRWVDVSLALETDY